MITKSLLETIEVLKKKYKLEDTDYVLPDDRKKIIIRKTGIKKIRKKEKIEITYETPIIISLSTSLGTEDAAYLTGHGTKKNQQNILVDQETEMASATPFNCAHTYKIETVKYRVDARLVLSLAGLDDCLGEDELNNSSANPAPEELIRNAQQYSQGVGRR